MERENRFWSSYDLNRIPDPLDTAVTKVNPAEAVAFVRGVHAVFNIVEVLNPDAIFFPQRGADPIDWALQQFQELYGGRDHPKIYLPIGTRTDPVSAVEWGPDKKLKQQIVRALTKGLGEPLGWFERPLLIDEVQSGATITDVVHNLTRAMINTGTDVPLANKLFVIAIQDSQNSWLTRSKAKGYPSIVRNTKGHIQAFVQEMPLFTVDRHVFLNYLLASKSANFRIPMILHNIEAEKFIKDLVTVVKEPEALDPFLDKLSDHRQKREVPWSEIENWYRSVARVAGTSNVASNS